MALRPEQLQKFARTVLRRAVESQREELLRLIEDEAEHWDHCGEAATAARVRAVADRLREVMA